MFLDSICAYTLQEKLPKEEQKDKPKEEQRDPPKEEQKDPPKEEPTPNNQARSCFVPYFFNILIIYYNIYIYKIYIL